MGQSEFAMPMTSNEVVEQNEIQKNSGNEHWNMCLLWISLIVRTIYALFQKEIFWISFLIKYGKIFIFADILTQE